MNDDYVVSAATLAELSHGDPKAGRRILRAMIDLEVEHEPINGPTEKPPNVRAAVAADEEAIMALVRQDIAENAKHIAPLDEECVQEFLQTAFEGRATVGVIDDGVGGLSGIIAFQTTAWWWSKRLFVQEMLCYTRSDNHSLTNARDLVKFSRWFVDTLSESVGYRVYLLSGVTATQGTHAKMALYRRLSNYVGGFFCYPNPTIS